MGTRASAEPAETGHDSALRELSDPEFFARWAQVRLRHAVTPQRSPEYAASKAAYDAVLAEYRRRMDGG
jgi:hypothetical protein